MEDQEPRRKKRVLKKKVAVPPSPPSSEYDDSENDVKVIPTKKARMSASVTPEKREEEEELLDHYSHEGYLSGLFKRNDAAVTASAKELSDTMGDKKKAQLFYKRLAGGKMTSYSFKAGVPDSEHDKLIYTPGKITKVCDTIRHLAKSSKCNKDFMLSLGFLLFGKGTERVMMATFGNDFAKKLLLHLFTQGVPRGKYKEGLIMCIRAEIGSIEDISSILDAPHDHEDLIPDAYGGASDLFT